MVSNVAVWITTEARRIDPQSLQFGEAVGLGREHQHLRCLTGLDYLGNSTHHLAQPPLKANLKADLVLSSRSMFFGPILMAVLSEDCDCQGKASDISEAMPLSFFQRRSRLESLKTPPLFVRTEPHHSGTASDGRLTPTPATEKRSHQSMFLLDFRSRQ